MLIKDRAGFSLLEVLIYVSVIAIVTSIIASVFLSLAQGQARADVRAEINSNLRFALDKINQDILSASDVVLPAGAGDTSNTLALTISTPVIYCVVGGRLRRADGIVCDINSEAITSDEIKIDNLVFTRLENTNIVLFKTVISIETVLEASRAGSNPDSQYTITKKITSSLR